MKVQSHRLTDLGRLSHPLCPIINPAKDHTSVLITPPCKERKLTTLHELQEVVQVLQFSPVRHAPSDTALEVWMELKQRSDPELFEGD